MNTPFFSIIIPTRNRYETLRYAILTVLVQDFKSFELIISDNSDEEYLNRIEIIRDYLLDDRIKYYRPNSILSMSDNWEFAVSKSTGNYLIIFGDDDGLVANSLGKINRIIQNTKAELISWSRIEYSWPDRIPTQYSNLTIIPYIGKTGILNSKDYINRVIRSKADYRYLPMFYNSAVSKETVELLKKQTGRVFNAWSPDIYTGYAFAHLVKKFITINYPFSINGVSARSNGAAFANNDKLKQTEYLTLLKKSEIKWPVILPEIYTSYLGIIEPFVQLTRYFPELGTYITKKKIYKIIIDTLEGSSESDYENKIKATVESSKNDRILYNWLIAYIAKVKPIYKPYNIINLEDKVGLDGYHIYIDASKFGLQNVYDVSIFINNIFGELKDQDYLKPVRVSLIKRIRKALGMIFRPA
ncbi:MAG: glycosyltransferase family A protein [Saprospiraceae bacterium]|nr:glycosyltransferase family A protein [Saprospiraceae bacterium]